MECEHIRTIIANNFAVSDDEKSVDDMLLAIGCIDSLDDIFDHIDEENEYEYFNDKGIYHSIVDNSQEEKILQAIQLCNINEFREYLMETLKPREYKILGMRYGFDRPKGMTLEEVGICMNVTRERVRQIEKKAFRKLRNPIRMKYLNRFI